MKEKEFTLPGAILKLLDSHVEFSESNEVNTESLKEPEHK
jgi:hypothetical protein